MEPSRADHRTSRYARSPRLSDPVLRMRFLRSSLLIALAAAVSACERVPTFARVDAAADRVEIAGLESRFAEISRQVSGFGGYFYGADGVLTAYVTDPATEPAARAALSAIAIERRPSLHERRDGQTRFRSSRTGATGWFRCC